MNGFIQFYLANLYFYKKKWFLLFTLFLLLSVSYSILKPNYESFAMLKVSASNDAKIRTHKVSNSLMNESYINTQVKLLKSRMILKSALSKAANKKISEGEIERFKSSIVIKHPPLTDLLEIKYNNSDSKKVIVLLNALLEEYLKWVKEDILSEARKTKKFIDSELNKQKNKLDELENQLFQYLNTNKISGYKEESIQKIEYFLEIERDLDLKTAQYGNAVETEKMLLDFIEKQKNVIPKDITDHVQIQDLTRHLRNTQIEYYDKKQFFTSESAELKSIEKKLKFIKQELQKNIQNLLTQNTLHLEEKSQVLVRKLMETQINKIEFSSSIGFLEKMNDANKEELSKLNLLDQEIVRLKRHIGIQKESYVELMKNKLENDLVLSQKSHLKTRILYGATPPKITNPLSKMFIFSFIASSLIFATWVYLLTYNFRYFPDSTGLQEFSSFPCLSEIPTIIGVKSGWPIIGQSNSSFFEIFRKLVLNLMLKYPDSTSFQVSSPGFSSGKTMIALNMAMTIGESGKKVLVIDCDHKKKDSFDFLKLEKQPLDNSEVLHPWKKGLLRTNFNNVWVTQFKTFQESPLEIVDQKNLNIILEEIYKEFNFVVFDSLSILDHTYPLIIAKSVSLNLIVTNLSKDSKKEILKANQLLKDVDVKNASWIVNFKK